ncbi:hypothetical protein ACFL34_05790 [Candidatus Sumerlaeota bacterium]
MTGTTPQTVDHGADCAAVTANAPGGFHFVKWTESGSDYSTDNPLTVINVTEYLTVISAFAPNEPPEPADLGRSWQLYE